MNAKLESHKYRFISTKVKIGTRSVIVLRQFRVVNLLIAKIAFINTLRMLHKRKMNVQKPALQHKK